MSNEHEMEFDIRPKSEMTLFFGGKRVGFLEGITLNFEKTSMLGIPKIQLGLVLEEKAFPSLSISNKVFKLVQKLGNIKLTILE